MGKWVPDWRWRRIQRIRYPRKQTVYEGSQWWKASQRTCSQVQKRYWHRTIWSSKGEIQATNSSFIHCFFRIWVVNGRTSFSNCGRGRHKQVRRQASCGYFQALHNDSIQTPQWLEGNSGCKSWSHCRWSVLIRKFSRSCEGWILASKRISSQAS